MENIEKCGKAYKCKISRGDCPFDDEFWELGDARIGARDNCPIQCYEADDCGNKINDWCKFLTKKLEKYPKYEFTTAQINLPNGEVYKVCDICGEKCKSNMGIEMHFRTMGHYGFINRGFCHKCSKKYEKLIDEFFDKLADKGGANG